MNASRFEKTWNRQSRSVPILGMIAHLALREERLQTQLEEDALYSELMESVGSTPQFPHHSEQRERYILAGELVSHILAVSTGFAAYFVFEDLLKVWVAT